MPCAYLDWTNGQGTCVGLFFEDTDKEESTCQISTVNHRRCINRGALCSENRWEDVEAVQWYGQTVSRLFGDLEVSWGIGKVFPRWSKSSNPDGPHFLLTVWPVQEGRNGRNVGMAQWVYRGNDNTLPVVRSSRWREVKGVGPKWVV